MRRGTRIESFLCPADEHPGRPDRSRNLMSNRHGTAPQSQAAEGPRWLSRRTFLHAGAVALGGTLGAEALAKAALVPAYAAGAQQIAPRISTTDLGGITLLQGAGCNVIAMAGDEGALMIDGGLAANAD